MSYQARTEGQCSKCGGKIEIGEEISWSRKGTQERYHSRCATATSETTRETNRETNETTSKTIPETTDSEALMYRTLAAQLTPYLSIPKADSVDEDAVREIVSSMDRPQLVIIHDTKTDTRKEVTGHTHSSFPIVCSYATRRKHVYMYGLPGAGKSTIGKQVAEALTLPYYYLSLSPMDTPSRLAGYMDANGKYSPTIFHSAYTQGGVLVLDELDNASASLQTTLNTAIENGHSSFPCGMVERHKDFVLLAAGNTPMLGATRQFPERRPADGAFRDRFRFVEVNYDRRLEEALTLQANSDAGDWLLYVRRLRDYCHKHTSLIVSPRVAIEGASDLKNGIDQSVVLDSLVFRGCDSDTKQQVLSSVK